MPFPPDITALLSTALAEDIGAGDITSLATIPADRQTIFVMNARQEMVVSGLVFLPQLFELVDNYFKELEPNLSLGRGRKSVNGFSGEGVVVTLHVAEGDKVPAGTALATLRGSARALLSGERVALNLVQQLSGVATLTRQYVEAVAGTGATILDTRKTILGMRHAQKYAVTCGGGRNHRMGLYDAVLIKDNHIAVAGGVAAAVKAAQHYLQSIIPNPQSPIPLEVECDTLAQLAEALTARVDVVLLDNMDNASLREAVAMVRAHNLNIMNPQNAEGGGESSAAGPSLPPLRGKVGWGGEEGIEQSPTPPSLTLPARGREFPRGYVKTEASGNVSLATVRAIAETGVDAISIGKLTHSAIAVDIGLDEG